MPSMDMDGAEDFVSRNAEEFAEAQDVIPRLLVALDEAVIEANDAYDEMRN